MGTIAEWRMLSAASEARFEVFVTIDKQLEHQQNLRTLPLPIVIVDGTSNTLPALEPFAPFLRTLFAAPIEARCTLCRKVEMSFS